MDVFQILALASLIPIVIVGAAKLFFRWARFRQGGVIK